MEEVQPQERAQWGRQIEFILTLVGYAVGLGNVWRFPYLCFKNGGGAFLIPYLTFLILLGIPVFALEVSFGQYGGKGPISIWYINKTMKGIGYAGALVSAVISIYYDVIIAWGLYYFFASMTDTVPWTKCTSCECLQYGLNETQEPGYDNVTGLNCTGWDGTIKSPSQVYFEQTVLQVTPSLGETGSISWQIMLCNLLAWLIVFVVLSKGIQSLGKVVYFTATFPYILLTILLIRGAIMPGALKGVQFYLTPKWERLADAEVWSDAAVQIFFSLSACQGGLVAMASYNKFSNNVLRDALMVPIINCLTSFYAGFVVFSTLGNMAEVRNISVANVTEGGPGLAFIAYPEALANMPITPLWSILFFLMLCTLGFSSQFSIVETVMTALIDEFPHYLATFKRKTIFRVTICLGFFVLGLPIVTQSGSYMLDLIDNSVLGFPTLFIALFEIIAIIYIYGYKNFSRDVEAMTKRKPFIYLIACWVFFTPVLILAVIVFKAYQYKPWTDKGFPVWAEVVSWFISMSPLAVIILVFCLKTCPNGIWARLRELSEPDASWIGRRRLGNVTVPIDKVTDTGLGGRKNEAFEPDSEKGQTSSSSGFQGYTPYAPPSYEDSSKNEYDATKIENGGEISTQF